MFSIARCYVFLGLLSHSSMTAGLESYPRKTLKKRVFEPLQNGDPFPIENYEMPKRGPCVFAGKTMPLGRGTIALECGELPARLPDQKWVYQTHMSNRHSKQPWTSLLVVSSWSQLRAECVRAQEMQNSSLSQDEGLARPAQGGGSCRRVRGPGPQMGFLHKPTGAHDASSPHHSAVKAWTSFHDGFILFTFQDWSKKTTPEWDAQGGRALSSPHEVHRSEWSSQKVY